MTSGLWTQQLSKSTQQTWKLDDYLTIQHAHIRQRAVEPQINLMPYAIERFQKPSKMGIDGNSGFHLFPCIGTNAHIKQLNLNSPDEDDPRFSLFPTFAVVHFVAALAILPQLMRGDDMQLSITLFLIAVISFTCIPSAARGKNCWAWANSSS